MNPLDTTKDWVERVVVGLNLCPFAAPVLRKDALRIHIAHKAKTPQEAFAAALKELEILHDASPTKIATTLIVYPQALHDFEVYLDVVAALEAGIEAAGLHVVFQIASFHPNYIFGDVEEDDQANFTNRSPFPTIHILREDDMEHAITHHPNTELIPEQNIARLRAMSADELSSWFHWTNT